jgi:subtilisin family serine protease
MARWLSAACAAAVVVAVLAVPATASAVQVCQTPPSVDRTVEDVPWAQSGYDPQNRLWPLSEGAGITVAVLDTGVEASHPQLAGRVDEGLDLVRGTPGATVDCTPHGTGLAGVIVAQPDPGTGFVGLAPQARVLPIQVTDEPRADAGGTPVSGAALAAGILAAVAQGAQVVDVGVVVYGDDPEVRSAVEQAVAAGVVVVAPAGDAHDRDRDGAGSTQLISYPAAYDGVLGVGAVDRYGGRVQSSQVGSYVDLLAPGQDVVSTGIGGQRLYQGTSIATAYVAATAALLLALPDTDRAEPLPAAGAARVQAIADRLMSTATGSTVSPRYGAGVLDPARALSESSSDQAPLTPTTQAAPPPDLAAEALADERTAAADRSTLVLAGLAGVVAVALLIGFVVPRARRRRWRTGRVQVPVRPDHPPEFLSGDALYRP